MISLANNAMFLMTTTYSFMTPFYTDSISMTRGFCMIITLTFKASQRVMNFMEEHWTKVQIKSSTKPIFAIPGLEFQGGMAGFVSKI